VEEILRPTEKDLVPGFECIVSLAAAEQSTTRWTRLVADMRRQKYRVYLGSPEAQDLKDDGLIHVENLRL